MRPDELANQTLKDSVIVKAGNKISFFDDSGKPLGNSLEKCLN